MVLQCRCLPSVIGQRCIWLLWSVTYRSAACLPGRHLRPSPCVPISCHVGSALLLPQQQRRLRQLASSPLSSTWQALARPARQSITRSKAAIPSSLHVGTSVRRANSARLSRRDRRPCLPTNIQASHHALIHTVWHFYGEGGVMARNARPKRNWPAAQRRACTMPS